MKTVSSLLLHIPLLISAVFSLQAQNVTGSGTPGTIPLWKGPHTIGNSVITQTATDVTITSEDVTVNGALSVDVSSGIAISGGNNGGIAVLGVSESDDGVEGNSKSGYGVMGESHTSYGVVGLSDSNDGVHGESTSGNGVFGVSESSVGVVGRSDNNNGMLGNSKSGIGVAGVSDTSSGMSGISTSGIGVHGTSTQYRGVEGDATVKAGVAGISVNGDGIGGASCSDCTTAAAVYGIGHIAGSFDGNVEISGDLAVTGFKDFHIDHPLDPANKYLNHFAIESDEVLNTYSGNVMTDLGGLASVQLPRWFEALNTNYRYQLTVIGEFAQAIVFQEIQNNRFVIKTDKPSVKVSWQVTGVRSDAYARMHVVPVEEQKPARERGHYLTPKVFGQRDEKSLAWLYHSDFARDAKAVEAKRKALGLSTKQQ
ncbi:MAG TPA: hypothetical protein VK788_28120 [Terriglobales bacterium]|nr:hypothetical protein [Terriglobales bacterium]